jgi:molecular chaperone GrpE
VLLGERSRSHVLKRRFGQTKQRKQEKNVTPGQQSPPEPSGAQLEQAKAEEIASLREQLTQEQEKSKENLNKLLYAQADFENYRKRLDQEVESRIDAGKARLVQDMLTIVDELELASKASKAARDTESASAVAEGLEIVLKKLRDLLAAEGLSKIEAIGRKFDPTLHEAVERVPCNDKEEGTILEEVREGFTIKGRVVRPSIVKIAVPQIAEPVSPDALRVEKVE